MVGILELVGIEGDDLQPARYGSAGRCFVQGLPCGELAGQGLPVKLDTNGLAPERIERLLAANLVECFAIDVKGPWTKYPLLTGGACLPERARHSLQAVFALAENHPDHFLFRLTEVPALSSGDIEEVEACLPDGFHLTRQEYRPVSDGQETSCPQAMQQ